MKWRKDFQGLEIWGIQKLQENLENQNTKKRT